MTLSERLKEVRKQHGCTRRQLAADLGRNYATITKYENGEREPGHTYLIEIARKFGVTTDYLLGLEDAVPEAGGSTPSDEAMRLAREFDSLDEWGRQAVRNTLELELQRKKTREADSAAARPLAAHDYSGAPLELRNSPDLADEVTESDFHD